MSAASAPATEGGSRPEVEQAVTAVGDGRTSTLRGDGFRDGVEPAVADDDIRGRLATAHEHVPESAPEPVHEAFRTASYLWARAYDDAANKLDRVLNYDARQANNLVGASITLGLSVIMIILMAIVAGYFVAEAPSNGAFSNAITQVESVGGTAFILLAVALLAVPVVAIVGYFVNSGLGGFISSGSMRR